MNQKFSFNVRYRIFECQKSVIEDSDSTYRFTDEDSEDLPKVTNTYCQGQDGSQNNTFLTFVDGITEPENKNSCKILNHFNKIYPDIILPLIFSSDANFSDAPRTNPALDSAPILRALILLFHLILQLPCVLDIPLQN